MEWREHVDLAMQDAGVSNLRPVIEKELLHYEIFTALDAEGLLNDLVFQGGTSLRLCRGSDRFSEDLDFAGGKDFDHSRMKGIAECLVNRIGERFKLPVTVKSPSGSKQFDNVKVDRWMVTIRTTPDRADLPSQKIKLEIANIPAYTRELAPLIQNYPSLQGMQSVLVNTESLGEILADKVLALPMSSIAIDAQGAATLNLDRCRYRDVWDIAWLTSKGAKLDPTLVQKKVIDYGVDEYHRRLQSTIQELPTIVESANFQQQMSRFLRQDSLAKTIGNQTFRVSLVGRVTQELNSMDTALSLGDLVQRAPADLKLKPRGPSLEQ